MLGAHGQAKPATLLFTGHRSAETVTSMDSVKWPAFNEDAATPARKEVRGDRVFCGHGIPQSACRMPQRCGDLSEGSWGFGHCVRFKFFRPCFCHFDISA